MNVKLKVISTAAIFFIGQGVYAQKKKDTVKEKQIEEVIVTVAYGKQSKETIVGSNTQVDAKKFADRSITSIGQALDGASPGVRISTSTGQPGSSPSVNIRGIGSISASNQPLYIVDGTPYTGSLSAINTEDIASFNILKDAAATSLYGSSAANGVVLITTKRGRKGKSVFSFNSSTSSVSRAIPEYSRVDAAQYYPLVWESLRNGYMTSNPSASIATANAYASNNLITILKTNVYNVPNNQLVTDGQLNPNASLLYNDFDWSKYLIRTGYRQNHDVSYSGGDDKSTFYASLGYLQENGYVIKSDFERFTAKFTADSQVKSWLKIGGSLAGTSSNGNNAIDGANNNAAYINPYRWVRGMGPIYSPYMHNPANGDFIYDSDGNKVFDPGSFRGADAAAGRNVIQETMLNKDLSKNSYLISREYIEIKPDKYLTFTMNVGYDIRNYRNIDYTNKIIGDAAPAGAASRTNFTEQTITFNQLVNYKRSFGFHNFEVMGGHENYRYLYEYMYGYKQGQVADGIDDLINFITPTELTSQTDTYTKESYFGRFNYDFNTKYLLSASIRRDASSRFAPEIRWHNFYSVGAGWRIKGENFLKNSTVVSELKLRGSYGEVGNDAMGSYYLYKDLFDLGYNNALEPGILFSVKADRSITWESNKQQDLGLDFGFFNNRISGSVEYFKRNTEGLLFSVPTPVSAGIPGSSINKNVGDMYNQGWEASLKVDAVKNENLLVSLNFNAATIKNRITKLPDGQTEIINGTKKLMVDHSIYDYWLRQWYGVDPADGSPLFLLDDKFAGTTAADIRTVNGVLVTTNNAKAKYDYSGTSLPKLYGSFGADINYKNFSLSTLFTYQIGGMTYDSNYASLMANYTQGGALSTDMLNRWTTPGQVTDIPAMNSVTYVHSGAASNRWLVKSDYISLRQATLSYTFSRNLLADYGISNLKIFVSGENIWSKTARKGLEPVQTFNGTTSNRYTPSKILTLGLNITL